MSGEEHGYDGWHRGFAFCLCGSSFESMEGFECHVGMTTSPPADTASTGAVEAPNIVQRIVNAWDCCGTCAGGILAAHDAATAERVRREGAALVRDDIQARRREFRRLNADQQYLNALDDAYGLAANRAREQAR